MRLIAGEDLARWAVVRVRDVTSTPDGRAVVTLENCSLGYIGDAFGVVTESLPAGSVLFDGPPWDYAGPNILRAGTIRYEHAEAMR